IIIGSVLLLISFFYLSCQKNSLNSNGSLSVTDPFANSAVNYLKENMSESDFEQLNINSLRLLKLNGVTQAIKIYSKDKSSNKFVIVGRAKLNDQNSKLIGNWVDVSIKNSLARSSKEIVLNTESFNSKVKSEFSFMDNKIVKISHSVNGQTKVTIITYPNARKAFNGFNNTISQNRRGVQSNEIHGPIDGGWLPEYTCTATDPNGNIVDFSSLYYYFNESPTYIDSWTPDPLPSGGGGGISNIVNQPTDVAPVHPVNIIEELKCFGSEPGSKYYITVNVDQPNPGYRDDLSGIDPGHTYFTLEQDNADGTKIIRTVGFYPENFAGGGGFIDDQSAFGDDSNRGADVTLTITVNSNDFMSVIHEIDNENSKSYNLDTYNCTTQVMQTLQVININLPATIHNGNAFENYMFQGYDPGDLGEDIRALNMTTFEQDNGDRQMVRKADYANDLFPPARIGSCD
ncbi:MAG: hypothetical protein ACRDE2_08105, partial [Chitinophagaceae bacterium]